MRKIQNVAVVKKQSKGTPRQQVVVRVSKEELHQLKILVAKRKTTLQAALYQLIQKVLG